MKSGQIENSQGFGLIEMMIVCGIIVMTFIVFARAEVSALRLFRAEQENMESSLLAAEALEAVRSVRDESWAGNIAWRTQSPLASPSVPYYPVVISGKWSLATSSPGLVNGIYARSVIFEKVGRDASDRIVSSGGTDDPGTRKVTSRVRLGTKTFYVVSYITNFQASLGGPTETKQVSYEGAATESNFNFPSGDGSGDLTQSFTAPASAIQVSRIDLLLRRDATTAPSDVYVELRTSAVGGTVLGTSNQITGTTIATSSVALPWVEFRFQNVVPLSASTIYTIRLRVRPSSTDNGSGASGLLYWKYGSSNPYAGGVASTSVGHLSNPNYGGTLWPNYDFGFKVYSSP